MNTIKSNLPFELQAFGYSFLRYGTKLYKPFARENIIINPLNEAAKEHVILYRIGLRETSG